MLRQFIRRLKRYRQPRDRAGASGCFTVASYDVHDLRDAFPLWDSYTDAEKLRLLEDREPQTRHEASNTWLLVGFAYLIDELDPNQSPSDLDASHIAVGDGTTEPSSGDTGLTNELARFAVGSTTDNGNRLTTSTILASDQYNGETVAEVGLVSASSGGTFFNHALVGPEDKTSAKEITITAELMFEPL